jgi:hypothetical protein
MSLLSTLIVAATGVGGKPNPNGLPGTSALQSLISGVAFWALLAALAGLLVSAAVWALSSHRATTTTRRWAGAEPSSLPWRPFSWVRRRRSSRSSRTSVEPSSSRARPKSQYPGGRSRESGL